MQYEVHQCHQCPDAWGVGAVDEASEGEMEMAEFSGTGAEERAREYAAWKNAGGRV